MSLFRGLVVGLLVLVCLLGGVWPSPPKSSSSLPPAPEPFPADLLAIVSGGIQVSFSPVGRTLAVAGEFRCNGVPTGLVLWDLDHDCQKMLVQKDLAWARAFAFSPDGKLFATGHREGAVRLWEAASCKKLAELGKHNGLVLCAAFSPDGRFLATTDNDRKVLVWDVRRRKKAYTLAIHTRLVQGAAFSPDSKVLATASIDGHIFLSDARTGRRIGSMGGGPDEAYGSICFSPDGKTLASCDDGVSLWEVATRRRRSTFKGHPGIVRALAFSPDGRFLASGCSTGTLKVHDLGSGKTKFFVSIKKFAIESLCFSPDSRILATGLSDRGVKLWDMNTGKEYVRPKADN